MDMDKMSIASDFSVIPDSMVNVDENDVLAVPMGASFFRSEHFEEEAKPSANSQFNKITFSSIQKVGVDPGAPLSVIFSTVDDDFTLKSSDRVALYKVGFSSSKDFLCYKWAPQPSTDDEPMPYTVLFEANTLPKDAEEFYQLCYLMQNGRIAGVSAPFQLRATENVPALGEAENAARKILSIRIRELVKENEALRTQIKDLMDSAQDAEFSKITMEQSIASRDEEIKQLSKALSDVKQTVDDNKMHIETLNRWLLEKENEIEQEKMVAREMQERLTATVMNMTEMKDTLSKSEEGKSISVERQHVLMQDNEDLKQTLVLVKEELETAMKEKFAAEKIASDLSERLQTTASDTQMLMITNSKLVKKVKKMQGIISFMEANSSDDWLCVDGVSEEKNEESDDNVEEERDDNVEEERDDNVEEERDDDNAEEGVVGSEREEGAAKPAISACMTCSATPTLASNCPTGASNCTSSCSSQHQLNETVSSVKSKMEAIVTQLSKQTEEMRALKKEVSRRNKDVGGAEASKREEFNTSSTSDSAASSLSNDDEKKVLYGKSFLPANRTAPVFLPSKGTTPPPPAPEKAPPIPPKRSGSLPPSKPSLIAAPSAPSGIPGAESSLPAPLCPETTPLARNAAVLKQFMDAVIDGVHQQVQQLDEQPPQVAPREEQPPQVAASQEQAASVPQMQEQQPKAAVRQLPHESNEDYHSTGDNGENAQSKRMDGSLKCPLCPLAFLPQAMRLMEEHINNHLDRTCPVCSLVFQRNIPQKSFEKHVHAHFSDAASDEDGSLSSSSDPSGPWDPRDTRRSFQLLEID